MRAKKDRLLRVRQDSQFAPDPELECELPNDLVTEGVKRRDRDVALPERREQVDALFHLRRGLFGERHGEDLLRSRATGCDQMRHSARQHPRLAGPGAGDDQHRAIAVDDRVSLCVGEIGERIAGYLDRSHRARDELELIRTSLRHQVLVSSPPVAVLMMLGSRAMRLGLRAMLAYSAGSVGAGAFYAFNNFVFPLLLSAMSAPDLLIGLLSSTRSIEGVVVQPAIGAWSDRLSTRLGRRRPFLLAAIPLSALFLFLAPFANTLVQVAVAIFLFSIFFNVAVDPSAALFPAIPPADQRGTLSGLSNGIQLVSQVAFLIVVSIAAASGEVPLWTFALCGAILLASFAVTIRFVHEPRQLAERAAHLPLRAYLETLFRNGQALRYLGTIFVYQFGLSAVIPFLPLFITKDLGQPNEIAIALSALTLLVTAASAIAFGAAADRVGHRTVLGIGWAILAVAALGRTVLRLLTEDIRVVV